MIYDQDIWVTAHPSDLWIYDKLILSSKLGYKCGPVGVPVPHPGYYIVRPITNLLGMGIGAEKIYIEDSTDHLKTGYFWCEIFTGRHLSIDYIDTKQTQCIEGLRKTDDPLWKWSKWKRVDLSIPFPPILRSLEDTNHINCEFIDGRLIEVHQRLNYDMAGYDEAIPVWENEPKHLDKQGYIYYNEPDYRRIGFWKK